ncbi:MAG: alpha/beta hydrolase, partial [Cyanobacteria bacterium P01_F01_bin.42]
RKVKPQVSQIKIPTLIFQSKTDSVVDPPGAQWLYDNLGSTNKSLEWLTESNHVLPLDLERTQIFQQVQTFLETLEASGDRDR